MSLAHRFLLFFFTPPTKQWLITSTPSPPLDRNTNAIPVCFVDAEPGTGISPTPPGPLPFLFANDVEIGNHFVFSVIMNIWRAPSGRVVV